MGQQTNSYVIREVDSVSVKSDTQGGTVAGVWYVVIYTSTVALSSSIYS